MMKQLEIKPTKHSNVIDKDHDIHCCKQKYKLDIYMNERDQIQIFNKWIKRVSCLLLDCSNGLNLDRKAVHQ